MEKLNGDTWHWIRTMVVVLSCVAAVVYGYSTTEGDIRVLQQRTLVLEEEAAATRIEYRMLSANVMTGLGDLAREVTCNSTKLDLLLRKDEL